MKTIAVLGTGRIGKMHAEIITQQIDGLEIAAVYDVYTEGAQAVADSIGCDRADTVAEIMSCLLYTSPSPRDGLLSRMPSSA